MSGDARKTARRNIRLKNKPVQTLCAADISNHIVFDGEKKKYVDESKYASMTVKQLRQEALLQSFLHSGQRKSSLIGFLLLIMQSPSGLMLKQTPPKEEEKEVEELQEPEEKEEEEEFLIQVEADPDAVNLKAHFDTDKKVIKVLDESILDEQERIDRRKADRACSDSEQRILNSRRELWQKIRGNIHDLSISYAPLSKKDKRWKDIYSFSYSKGFKHIEFVGGIGHSGMETLWSDLLDTDILTDNLGERITPSHLEKVKAVKIVYMKINLGDVREEILYFLRDGKVKSFTLQQLLMKTVT
ncbi:hypothetical protein AgCh_040216 [Apium graveolens]